MAAPGKGAPSRSAPCPIVDTKHHRTDAEHFEAAIARHRLDLQTQLKRSTSLPSAMFDANDAMLEARLCAATEGIFQKLLEWDAPRALPTDGEQRLEKVHAHELTALLMAALHGEFAKSETPRLDEQSATEFAGILAEAAARSVGKPQQRAQELLAKQNAADAQTIDDAARAIADSLAAILRGAGNDGDRLDGDGDAMDEQQSMLRQLCERIGDAAARCAQGGASASERSANAPVSNDEDDAS